MLEQFLNHIREHRLCGPADRILLAVSGGIDSVVMLRLFHETGQPVAVAHCNFQLRGEASDGDQQFVATLCHDLDVPCFVKRMDTAAYAETEGLSTQLAARALRYAWFEEVRVREGFDRIATAHHLNDALETVLLNWTRSANPDGLAGIPVQQGVIIRPLLFATRAAVEAYAASKDFAWREDASNQTDDYARNFIRHQVVPRLKELNPSLEQTVSRGLASMEGVLSLAAAGLEHWKTIYTTAAGNRIAIRKAFAAAPHAVAILARYLRPFGFHYSQCEDMVYALAGQPGKQFLAEAYTVMIDREALILTPHRAAWDVVTLATEHQHVVLGDWTLAVERSEAGRPLMGGAWHATVDADRITFPITWRRWRAGDVFYPLGMNHGKKISDFLIDSKVARADKAAVTVLEAGERIFWVVGHRLDDRFKVTAATKQVLTFTIRPHIL
ncbi:tRNA lysidine(34) synthetase TilS [Parachryseolinea silvisoli]|uniref:tRNA lysidine(34) synthetase TilS n=1 Tax=Parachryseolinea silvisoli TaxID=2873601 RepID=UPI002265EC05|nr:tRNA lysidine(34) synthetase TilS [Parachryseolinea silvisoli]MCD9014791.1 tRNA lysidine(34) synthetase TilS [Parachryseolinea silvisoli]